MSVIKDKTLILITHRLSMLRVVDRLIVMDGGKVLMDGPRDAVLRRLQGRGKKAQASPADTAVQTNTAGEKYISPTSVKTEDK
jgi:ATP-binding cassette subfamily C protein LapB